MLDLLEHFKHSFKQLSALDINTKIVSSKDYLFRLRIGLRLDTED